MNIKKILPLFSYIFHPIFISFYGFSIYLGLSETGFNSLLIILLIQVLILTILLPLSIYFLLKATGNIKSFTEASIHERKFPILLQILFIYILLKFSGILENLPALYYFLVGGLIAALTALLFTLTNFKVSLHMTGISALLCFVVSLSVYLNVSIIPLIAILIVIVGNVASSRLYMKSHTAIELIAGTLIGLLSQAMVWQFYL